MSLAHHIITVTDFSQNCTILACTETQKAAVVDPGGDLDKIEAYLFEHRLQLEKILITHGHIDHVAVAEQLATQFGVRIYGPEKADSFWLDSLPSQAVSFHFSPSCAALKPDHWLNDGDSVSVGNETLTVIHCPGHTPGHVVFYSSKANLLIAGDVLFYRSIGRSDLPYGNHEQLVASIKQKLFTLPDETLVFAGHGRTTTIGQEKTHNPFLQNI